MELLKEQSSMFAQNRRELFSTDVRWTKEFEKEEAPKVTHDASTCMYCIHGV